MDLEQAIDRVRASIVQISVFPQKQIFGTGFFVTEEAHIITAQHVIEAVREQSATAGVRAVVGLAQPNTENMRANFNLVDFDVVDEDARHDLALIKLKQNPFTGQVRSGIVINGNEVSLLFGSAQLGFDRPRDGQSVGISGYPLGIAVLVTSHGCIASSWSFDIQQLPFPGLRGVTLPQVADIYLADVEVNPGNSGAPVYAVQNAEVIGVCVASRPTTAYDQAGNPVNVYTSSGLTIVVPAKYIGDLLVKNNIRTMGG